MACIHGLHACVHRLFMRSGSKKPHAMSVCPLSCYACRYSALANLPTAVLQGVAIYLEVTGHEKAAKTVELIDKLVLALTSTSAPLLFAVDDITSCGGPPRAGGRARGQPSKGFTKKIQTASFASLGTLASAAGAAYTARVERIVAAAPTLPTPTLPSPVSLQLPPTPRPRRPSRRQLRPPPPPLPPP